MKNTIYLILLMLVIAGFTPKERNYITNENTDKRFLELINEYRDYYNLPHFKWNDTTYNMAKHHTEYQYRIKKVTHRETHDIINFNELKRLTDRANYFKLNSAICMGCPKYAENLTGGITSLELVPEMAYAKFVKRFFNKEVKDCNPVDRIIYQCIWNWEYSPTHKEVLVGNYSGCGFSLKYVVPDVFEKSLFHEGRPTQRNRFYATLNTVLK